MTESKKKSVSDPNPSAAKPDMASEKSDPPNRVLSGFEAPAKLDYWFNSQLMQMYSEVVSEPLPKDLLDLLDKLREKKKSTPQGS